MVECFDENGKCVITPACRLKRLIGAALDAYMQTLEEFTLDDLIAPEADLSEILGICDEAA